MTRELQCNEFVERLAELLEREVDETTRAALESHALACAECGGLLADMRKLRIDAASLPVLVPSRELWQGIAERIDAPVIPLRPAALDSTADMRRWRRWAPMAAAAVLLVAVTSTTTYYLTIRTREGSQRVASVQPVPIDSSVQAGTRSQPSTVVATSHNDGARRPVAEPRLASVPVVAVASNVRLAANKPSAEQVYQSEIARLHTIVERRRAQLDPVTISVIERNLKVIDEAIAQCKLALAKDPASRFLMESLNNALENKVELLRTATMLPPRSS
jgi:Putative zinc-finger